MTDATNSANRSVDATNTNNITDATNSAKKPVCADNDVPPRLLDNEVPARLLNEVLGNPAGNNMPPEKTMGLHEWFIQDFAENIARRLANAARDGAAISPLSALANQAVSKAAEVVSNKTRIDAVSNKAGDAVSNKGVDAVNRKK